MTTASPDEAPPPRAPDWLRLQAALSGTALIVVVLRTVQLGRMAEQGGGHLHWHPILATQAAFWIGWSLWAGVLVFLMRGMVERPPRPAARLGRLVLLVLVPAFLVPVLYAPVHWLTFEGSGRQSLGFALRLTTTHDLVTNVLLSAAIAGVTYGYLGLQRARRLEVTAARLNTQLTRAQLDTLRAQLNPHFLFNALNSVAVLARRGKTAEVEQMVTRLAALLRHSLESSRDQLVTLRVELEALDYYLGIERVRHGDRLAATFDVPVELLDRVVPSLLLQPLVENAIRHGFVDGTRPLRIEVRARAEERNLVLSVVDDGPGPGDRAPPAEGLGLGNTRARLAGLYGAGASLTLGPAEGGRGARVTVVLPEITVWTSSA